LTSSWSDGVHATIDVPVSNFDGVFEIMLDQSITYTADPDTSTMGFGCNEKNYDGEYWLSSSHILNAKLNNSSETYNNSSALTQPLKTNLLKYMAAYILSDVNKDVYFDNNTAFINQLADDIDQALEGKLDDFDGVYFKPTSISENNLVAKMFENVCAADSSFWSNRTRWVKQREHSDDPDTYDVYPFELIPGDKIALTFNLTPSNTQPNGNPIPSKKYSVTLNVVADPV
jgi:hypothetical protein